MLRPSRAISGRLGDTQPSFSAYLSSGAWQQLPIPAGPKNLRVQVALSPSDAWATVTGGFMHWDGSSWQKASVPWLDEDVAWIEAMAASATDDVWGVGHKAGRLYKTPDDGPGEHTQGQIPATLHWDGSAWSEIAVPSAPGRSSTLYGVSSRGGETWAVGWYERKVGEVSQKGGGLPHELVHHGPIALRWDGAQWVEMAPPNAGGGGTALLSVHVLGPEDVWVSAPPTVATTPPRTTTWVPHTSLTGTARAGIYSPQRADPTGVTSLALAARPTTISGWAAAVQMVSATRRRPIGTASIGPSIGPEAFPSGQTKSGRSFGAAGGSEPEITAASPSDVWFNPGFTRFGHSPSDEDQRQVDASASDPMLFHWDGQSWAKVMVDF